MTKQASTAPIKPKQLRSVCSVCSLRELCLPAGLDPAELNTLDKLVNRRRAVARGDCLFHHAAPMQALYAIRTGFLKTNALHADGHEQVTGFHMRGDLLGLDALGGNRHVCSAVALDDSEICEIPLHALDRLSRDIPSLQQHLQRIMSLEIAHEHGMMMLLGGMRAEERLATFLLDLSQRYATRGYSSTELMLHMTRAEIGSYLGVTLETVSRCLSHLRAGKLIEVHTRLIRITDMAGLKSAAGCRADICQAVMQHA